VSVEAVDSLFSSFLLDPESEDAGGDIDHNEPKGEG